MVNFAPQERISPRRGLYATPFLRKDRLARPTPSMHFAISETDKYNE